MNDHNYVKKPLSHLPHLKKMPNSRKKYAHVNKTFLPFATLEKMPILLV